MSFEILCGDSRELLKTLPAESVQCVVTSPPYWGLREYGTGRWEGGDPDCDHRIVLGGNGTASAKQVTSNGTQGYQARGACPKCGAVRHDLQIGLEASPEAYVAEMVALFREVWRVLRPDGTVWLNIGDCYAGSRCGPQGLLGEMANRSIASQREMRARDGTHQARTGAKPKDLLGMPWMVAFALRTDGWWLRQDNIWAKRNCMPESIDTRTTRAHEYIFQLAKSGAPLFWTHRDLPGVRARPEPDYRWIDMGASTTAACGANKIKVPGGWDRGDGSHGTIHRNGRTSAEYQAAVPSMKETDQEPPNWKNELLASGKKRWRRVNLWEGHDYFYDSVAIEEEGETPAGTKGAKGSAARAAEPGVNGRPPEYASYTGRRNKRSVWHVATQPFSESHFATMPPAIVETCVLAGSSERGCCAACGAPWYRVTDVEYENPGNRTTNGPRSIERKSIEFGTAGYAVRLEKRTATTGWCPTCTCDAGEPVPCKVLDPFAGACTTLLVADRFGRHGIGLELNPEYVEMGRRRIVSDSPLLAADKSADRPPQQPAQDAFL